MAPGNTDVDRQGEDAEADALVRRRLSRHPELEQVAGPGSPRHCPLEEKRTTLGRSEEADIRVESASVSGIHLLLSRQGAEVVVEDQASRNGTFLNGLQVQKAVLKEGDSLMAGDAIFLFHEGD